VPAHCVMHNVILTDKPYLKIMAKVLTGNWYRPGDDRLIDKSPIRIALRFEILQNYISSCIKICINLKSQRLHRN